MENTALMMVDNQGNMMGDDFNVHALTNAESQFMKAFAPGFEMDEIDTFNSVQTPEKTVSDNIGDEFNLVGIICHAVTVVNEKTGEVIPSPRIILIGSKGESYVSVSKTLFSSLKNLFAMYRKPSDWNKTGIPIKLRQTSKGEKRYFSVEILKPKK